MSNYSDFNTNSNSNISVNGPQQENKVDEIYKYLSPKQRENILTLLHGVQHTKEPLKKQLRKTLYSELKHSFSNLKVENKNNEFHPTES